MTDLKKQIEKATEKNERLIKELVDRSEIKCLDCGDSGYDDYDKNGEPLSFCETCRINSGGSQ